MPSCRAPSADRQVPMPFQRPHAVAHSTAGTGGLTHACSIPSRHSPRTRSHPPRTSSSTSTSPPSGTNYPHNAHWLMALSRRKSLRYNGSGREGIMLRRNLRTERFQLLIHALGQHVLRELDPATRRKLRQALGVIPPRAPAYTLDVRRQLGAAVRAVVLPVHPLPQVISTRLLPTVSHRASSGWIPIARYFSASMGLGGLPFSVRVTVLVDTLSNCANFSKLKGFSASPWCTRYRLTAWLQVIPSPPQLPAFLPSTPTDR